MAAWSPATSARLRWTFGWLDAGEPLPQMWVLEPSSFQLETLPAAGGRVGHGAQRHRRPPPTATPASMNTPPPRPLFSRDGVQVLNREDAR